MEAVVENYFGKKVFYRSRGNLWEIPVKIAIRNTFTKINFTTGVLQRVCLDFKQCTIVLKFPEDLFRRTYFNDCFCPYGMKLFPSLLFSFFFCSLLVLHLCTFLP